MKTYWYMFIYWLTWFYFYFCWLLLSIPDRSHPITNSLPVNMWGLHGSDVTILKILVVFSCHSSPILWYPSIVHTEQYFPSLHGDVWFMLPRPRKTHEKGTKRKGYEENIVKRHRSRHQQHPRMPQGGEGHQADTMARARGTGSKKILSDELAEDGAQAMNQCWALTRCIALFLIRLFWRDDTYSSLRCRFSHFSRPRD